MEISCDNCGCSKCKRWKECNDGVYEVDYWCFRCQESSVDHCHEVVGECGNFELDEDHTHPLYNEKTFDEADQYYQKLDCEFAYKGVPYANDFENLFVM
jgi:hypothetical protein